jgi:hypothetical protein
MTDNAEVPRAKPGRVCPFHRKDMAKVCHTCPLWVKVVGKSPQSEELIDRWDCSLAWAPLLLIENSQMSRQTGAAVESLRNEMVSVGNAIIAVQSRAIVREASSGKLIEG